MSWLSSLGVALLGSIASGCAAYLVAERWAHWYRWSGFEGAAGYVVLFWALVGLVAGLALGFLVARRAEPDAAHAFLRASGTALAIVAVSAGTLAAAGRAAADVRPTLDGETLTLMVEVRWPASQQASPAHDRVAFVRLRGRHRRSAHGARGPLWAEDAHRVEGRWVASGAADLVTERGHPTLEIVPDASRPAAAPPPFVVPVRGRPTDGDFAWSAWLSHGDADGFAYRWRVQRRRDPVRTRTLGPFEVVTHVLRFLDRDSDPQRAVEYEAAYAIRHRGTPVVVRRPEGRRWSWEVGEFATVDEIVEVRAPRPALVVLAGSQASASLGALLVDEIDGTLHVEPIPGTQQTLTARPLRAAALRLRGAPDPAPGGDERASFTEPGRYLVGRAVLDTRTLTVRTLPPESEFEQAGLPVALSPDERTLVRLGRVPDAARDAYVDALAVTDLATGRTDVLPIDRRRQRFASTDEVDAAWMERHFTWVRGAGGCDQLVARPDLAPRPHHGRVDDGTWTAAPADAALRDALVAVLVTELGAERLADDGAGEGSRRVRVGRRELRLSAPAGSTIAVQVDDALPDDATPTIARVGRVLDAALATGRFDHLFLAH